MMRYFYLQGNISHLWELQIQILPFKIKIRHGYLSHKMDLQFRYAVLIILRERNWT